MLRTGEVAERAGVNVQTLRYYERRGLLAAPDRSIGATGSIRRTRWPCCR
jgi:DNA-binding transcriptional MerR regulator